MARTRATAWRMPNNNFNNWGVATTKEIANFWECRNHEHRFKIKFLLLQGNNVEVKEHCNVVRWMRVRRKAIFLASVKERRYPRN